MQESFSPRHKWRDLRDCATASVSDAQIATMVNGMKASIDKIPLGITDDEVPLGSHLIHFWQTDEEFERGGSVSRTRDRRRISALCSIRPR